MPNISDRSIDLRAEDAYAVLYKARALEDRGAKVIHLEIGQPDFETALHISKAGIDAIRAGHTKYNPPLGLPDFRKKIAQVFSETRGDDVSFENVAVTPGGKAGIYAVLSLLINPGDEVIFPSPGFPTYEILIDHFGGVKKPVPLLEENDFSFDTDVLKESISPKTKIIIINSPSNPTGSIIPKKDLELIADLAKKNDIWVFSDEIYSQIVYGGKGFESIWSIPGMKKRTFVLDGFSKTYSMTGWRLGYLVCPEGTVDSVSHLLTHMVGCTATFTQYAGMAALSGSQAGVKEMVSSFEKRRDYMIRELNKIDGVTCRVPMGAFYAFPNIKAFGKSSDDVAKFLLEKGKVALLSGTSFGKYGEGYLRISYANSLQNIKRGVIILKDLLPRM